MPGEAIRWTGAMRQAWQWVHAYQAEGFHATGALEEYRETGGRIRTADWHTAWHAARETSEIGSWVQRLPEEEGIPRDYYTESGFDWTQDYVIQVQVRAQDKETGLWTDEWKTLEYDDTVSIDTVRSDLAYMYGEIYPWMDEATLDIVDLNLYHRAKR